MRRAALSVLMLAVLLPSSAFARIGYLCARDRQVRASCCCPAKEKKPAPTQTTLAAASCCEVSQIEPTRPLVVDVQEAATSLAPPAVAVVPVAPASTPPRREVAFAPRAHGPPDPGRSLFSSHCALLL